MVRGKLETVHGLSFGESVESLAQNVLSHVTYARPPNQGEFVNIVHSCLMGHGIETSLPYDWESVPLIYSKAVQKDCVNTDITVVLF